MDFNQLKLNQQQIQATKTINGPILVVAGAGSGKTKVLTTRVAYLIQETGCPEESILAITFTNFACNEMRTRIANLLNHHTNVNVLTFHSLCLRILREEIEYLGGRNDFRIIDEEEQLSIISQIYKDWNLRQDFGKRVKPKLMQNFISEIQDVTANENNDLYSKTTLKTDTIYSLIKSHLIFESDVKYINGIYKQYQEIKQKNNWLDFNDLIYSVYKLFKKSKSSVDKWSQRFQYILVDEFQDTDYFQFTILKQLVNENKNIFVVGDPDQTIYEWRGAYAQIFNDFKKTFENTTQIILDKNYRSTKKILNVANSLIKNNVKRIDKTLITDNQEGENVIYYLGDSQHEEGKFIANKINELVNKEQYQYKDIAVLYRSNFLSRFIENALIDNNISYQIYGGVKFYQRKEIKDILAYLRLLVDPNDELAIKRVINTPARGIGETTLDKILSYALNKNLSFSEVIKYNKLNHNDITWDDHKISKFFVLINQIKQKSLGLGLEDLVKNLIKMIDYENYLNTFETPLEAKSRIENINELIFSIKEFDENSSSHSIDEFLQSIALYTDTSSNDFKSRNNQNNVNVMTIHFAKGSEYKVIFIAGLYEGVFPSRKSVEQNNIEEERRIFFVGITRAKERLFFSSNIGSTFIGKTSPSFFLNEINQNEYEEIHSNY